MWVGLRYGGAMGLDVSHRHNLISKVDVDAGQEKTLGYGMGRNLPFSHSEIGRKTPREMRRSVKKDFISHFCQCFY